MARKNFIVSLEEVKGLISADQDFLKSMIQQALQEVPEAEMNEALQSAKNGRSEKVVVSTLVEMYVQGVSTRKVKALTEHLCGQQ